MKAIENLSCVLYCSSFYIREQGSNDKCMQGILYTGGRGWYRMCSRQPTVGLVAPKLKQNIFSAQTATF
jgi:hypothetical protein